MSQQIIVTESQEHNILEHETVASVSRRVGDPDWLVDKRRVAWGIFEDTPWPAIQDEHWRRTSLRKIKWNRFQLANWAEVSRVDTLAGLPKPLRQALDQGKEAAGRIALINGQVAYLELDPALVEQGVIFSDLSTAALNHADLVKPYLMTEAVPAADGKFAAWNGAMWNGGVFIYVPRDVVVDHPFQAAVSLTGENVAVFPRTLIVADRHAVVDYIEETVSNGDSGQALNVGAVEIYTKEGARVRYVDMQRWGEDVFNFNTKRAVCSNDSLAVWDTGQLGGRLTKTYADTLLKGDGSSMEYQGVYFVEDNQHLDIDCLIHHIGLATGGDLLLHGALKDKSRMVFRGLIKIDPTGQQTNSYLKNENLMLTDTARADSIPSLQIDANDVRASHGATIGQIDEEYIFYLQSRGIPRSTAIRMIVEGFFAKVYDRFGNQRVRDKLFAAVAAKIGM
jgi:Fe-S cluster assembly protein SufD